MPRQGQRQQFAQFTFEGAISILERQVPVPWDEDNARKAHRPVRTSTLVKQPGALQVLTHYMSQVAECSLTWFDSDSVLAVAKSQDRALLFLTAGGFLRRGHVGDKTRIEPGFIRYGEPPAPSYSKIHDSLAFKLNRLQLKSTSALQVMWAIMCWRTIARRVGQPTWIAIKREVLRKATGQSPETSAAALKLLVRIGLLKKNTAVKRPGYYRIPEELLQVGIKEPKYHDGISPRPRDIFVAEHREATARVPSRSTRTTATISREELTRKPTVPPPNEP